MPLPGKKFGSKVKEEKSSSRKRFVYKPSSAEAIRERQNQRGSSRESIIQDGVKVFAPSKEHTIRFLPRTWEEDGGTFGYPVWLHYGVGAEGGTFLCPKQMGVSDSCPICDVAQEAFEAGDDDLAEKAKPKRRILYYVIDRDHESEGPKVWSAPWTFDRDLNLQSTNKRTDAILHLDSPFLDDSEPEGYDVDLSIQGTKPNIKYVFSISRTPSPLSDDEDDAMKWLEEITEKPLPDVLVWHDEGYVNKVVAGGFKSFDDNKEKEKEEKPSSAARSRKRDDADDEEVERGLRKAEGVGRLKKRAPAKEEEEEQEEKPKAKTSLGKRKPKLPSYEEVMEMEETDLVALGEQCGVDFDQLPDDRAEEVNAWVCEQLGIEPSEEDEEEEEEEEKPAKKMTPKERLASLRKNLSKK